MYIKFKFKLKDELSFNNFSHKFYSSILKINKDTTQLIFQFDYNGLNEAEQQGWYSYIKSLNKQWIRIYVGISKKLKHITYSYGDMTKITYDFYSDEEYKRVHKKKIIINILKFIGLTFLMTFLMILIALIIDNN